MFGFLRRVAPILIVFVFAISASAFSDKSKVTHFGGEIPWPLSIQHVVTVQNSKGLWKLESKNKKRMFNVEMESDIRSGFDWIRVSELDPKTYEVISWGEGFFTPPKKSTPESSFSNILTDVGPVNSTGKDKYGRYLSMFRNGDFNEHPYMLRMVEVETTLGHVLGLTVIEYSNGMKYQHFLGTRVLEVPLGCVENDRSDNLKCFMDL